MIEWFFCLRVTDLLQKNKPTIVTAVVIVNKQSNHKRSWWDIFKCSLQYPEPGKLSGGFVLFQFSLNVEYDVGATSSPVNWDWIWGLLFGMYVWPSD